MFACRACHLSGTLFIFWHTHTHTHTNTHTHTQIHTYMHKHTLSYWLNMLNVSDDGWWMVQRTPCPLGIRSRRTRITRRAANASKPNVGSSAKKIGGSWSNCKKKTAKERHPWTKNKKHHLKKSPDLPNDDRLCSGLYCLFNFFFFLDHFRTSCCSCKAAPKIFSVSSLLTDPFSWENRIFLPNIPPLFQLVALFLAVAVLGMCSQTTEACMHALALARATGDTCTR